MPDFQFQSLADFLAMGGYALYVWLGYGFFFIVMGWNLIQPWRDRQKILKLLRARQQREAGWQDNRPVPEEVR
ncbi:MAG TPA: heme exporter protein CcmD [Hyphomicrobiales bacterium]|nr:heme exporter protein CcmD [Hyphomicrobiales bacterium]